MDTYIKYQFQRLRELAIELAILQRYVTPGYLGKVERSIDNFVPYWPVSDNWKKKRSNNPFRSLGTAYSNLPSDPAMYENHCKETARVWTQFENMIFDHIIMDDNDDDSNIDTKSLEKKDVKPSVEPRIKIEGECTRLDLKLLGEVKQSSTVRNRIKDHITLHSILIFEAKQEIEFLLEIRKDILYKQLNRLEEDIKSAKFKDFSPTEDWTKTREENHIYLTKNEGREHKRLEKIKKANAKEILLKKVREAREELRLHNRLEKAKLKEDALLRKRTLAANKAASKKQKLAHQSPYDNDDNNDDNNNNNNKCEDNVNDSVMSWYNPNEIYLNADEEMIRKIQEKEREEMIRKTQEEEREVVERILMAEQERIQKDHCQKTREADYLSKEKHARTILYSTDCASNQFNEVWTEFKDHYSA